MVVNLNFVYVILIVSCIQGICFAQSTKKREDGDCPPVELENGIFEVLGKNYTAGDPIPKYSIVKFTCNDNYALYPANPLVSCIEGAWNIPVPQCKRTCQSMISSSADVNCTIDGRSVDCSQPLVEGTVVVSKCKQFYTPVYNDTSISKCSNGTWDNNLVKCDLECGEVSPDGATLITKAKDADKGKFPWHVALYKLYEGKGEYYYDCGGSIISPSIFITGAVCIRELTETYGRPEKPLSRISIAAGKYYKDFNSEKDIYVQKRKIKEVHIPPLYRGLDSLFVGDIAVVVVDEPFEMNNLVRPVCVDWFNEFESEQLRDNNVGTVVGWGFNRKPGDDLQQLDAPYLSLQKCFEVGPSYLRNLATPDKFCTDRVNETSVCHGDNGGGLVFEKKTNNTQKYYVRGLVSVGPSPFTRCEDHGVYTKISYYRDFILNIVKKNQIKEDSCPAVTIENGDYRVFDFNYKQQGLPVPNNALVQITCNSDYTLVPEESSLLTCVDGFWNGPIPKCKLDDNIVQPPCPPISIEKGQIYVTGQNYTPGTPVPAYAVVEFSCEPGYALYPTNPLITCVNSKWNVAIPQCKLTCPPLISSTVDVSCTLDGNLVDCKQPMVEGTVATSICKQFYTASYNEIPISTCTGGSWDNPLVRCIPDCGELVSDGVTNIIKGQDAKKGDFPWHIALYRLEEEKYEYQCGGSIISQLIVVTAAHCFTDTFGTTRYPAQEYYVGAGKYYSDYNSEADVYAQKRHVKEYYIPREFTGYETNYAGDLAVVVIEKPFKMTNLVQPVCMDWFSQFEATQLVPNNTGQVVGWGFVDPNKADPSENLKLLNAPYISRTKCIKEFPSNFRRWVTTDKFCAGVRNGSSICKGDSGGGLVFKWSTNKFYLRGLVSVGPIKKGTCDNFQYGVYTRISSYKDFILNIRRLNQVKD